MTSLYGNNGHVTRARQRSALASFRPLPREPSKSELREQLAQAVRNTAALEAKAKPEVRS